MKKNLAGNEKGFTLIELIVVIVLLGILAAVAIPKYQDLTAEASKAASEGLLSAARGAAVTTFAKNLVKTPAATTADRIEATAAGDLILRNQIETDYTMTSTTGGFSTTINGTTYTYTISPGETATSPAKIVKNP